MIKVLLLVFVLLPVLKKKKRGEKNPRYLIPHKSASPNFSTASVFQGTITAFPRQAAGKNSRLMNANVRRGGAGGAGIPTVDFTHMLMEG